jgi:hypothetical protein
MQFLRMIYSAKYSWLVIPLLVVFIVWCFALRQTKTVNYAKGPAYDLIFGVNVFDPNLKSKISVSPYVIDGTLYVQCEKVQDNEGTVSTSIALYRYNSKLGTVEKIPLPTTAELGDMSERKNVELSSTQNLKLNSSEQSPDGFVLAEPKWVKVDPISNVLGNITLFFLSGGFQDILERESFPRLNKGAISIPMKSDYTILKNEADNAYLLGWVTAEGNH